MRRTIIALMHTMIRGDEKLLIDAAKNHGVVLDVYDVRQMIFNPQITDYAFKAVLERCVSTIKGMHICEFFESIGLPVINSLAVARVCENKFSTSIALYQKKVPQPQFAICFSETQAKEAIEKLGGYPVVLKPVTGSWGRLIAKINDIHALEAVIEQKITLGGPHHHVYYLQQYIDKPGRDIRIHIIGGRAIAAIYRKSSHWITNTARGAEPLPCKITPDLEKIAKRGAAAVGDGVFGIDIFETDDGYLVNEVNHTMEFKNVQRVTGIDVAGTVIDYCLKRLKNEK